MENSNQDDQAVSPAFHTTSAGHSVKPVGHTHRPGTPESDRRPADTPADEDEITQPRHSSLSAQSLVHSVLGNFFFARSLISLIIFIAFFTVTWFTVLQDARSMNDGIFFNTTGVSLCLCRDEWTLLMTVATAGIDTRSQP